MNKTLEVALLQTSLEWHDAKTNRDHIEALMENADLKGASVDLLILPEMFASGFTMSPAEVAEEMDGETVQWLIRMAADYDMAIAGSLVITEDSKYYNRFLMVEEEGIRGYYDKKHLFTLAGEEKVYEPGASNNVLELRGWKILPQVCYDLRFPVWSRNTCDYDLCIYVANWPDKRVQAWDILLRARAIENMAYCVGVNRIGKDPNKHLYTGHSAAIDPLGNALVYTEQEGVFRVTLDHEKMMKTRKKLRFLNDRDEFTLK
ncbi:amidohydrolase [Robertkochia aurantiaca]|uniref:amidohydrolase n=1 Tax=Robertkochia aurantiaca TaxID=2873700 RepID=UPI001CCF4854|nr:amidohydrolase [Robertkochia sp. 3YJGBD-33]